MRTYADGKTPIQLVLYVSAQPAAPARMQMAQLLACAAQCHPVDGQPLINVASVSDPYVDVSIQRAQRTLDWTTRVQQYGALYRYAAGRYDYLPLYDLPNIALVRGTIHNFQLDPQPEHVLWNVGDWWTDA